MGSASTLHLPFGDHMHQFDAGQQDPGTAESLEPQHGPRASLDRPMILLDHVVEIFALANLDRPFTIGIDRFERGEIGAAFVNRHGVRFTVLIDRFLKIPPDCRLVTMGPQQEINRVACLVDRAYKYFHCPLTLMYVSSMRQLLPTGRLRRRNAFSSTGNSFMAQRCTVE